MTLVSVFFNSIPVSAVEYELVTKTYSGEELFSFISLYDTGLYARSDVSSDFIEIGLEEYQVGYGLSGANVYIILNLRKPVEYNGYYLDWNLIPYIDLDVHSFKNTVYGRKVRSLPESTFMNASLVFNVDTSLPFSEYYTKLSDSTFAYPFLNMIVNSDGSFLDVDDPIQSMDNNNYYTSDSLVYSIDYSAGSNVSDVNHLSYLHFYIDSDWYDNADPHLGTFVFCVSPITITAPKEVVEEVDSEIADLKDSLLNSSPEQEKENAALKDKADSAASDMKDSGDKLKDSSDKLNNVYKPDVDITEGFEMDSDISDGLNVLAVGFSPFYENKYILLIMAAVVPIFIVSYLLFGKKG